MTSLGKKRLGKRRQFLLLTAAASLAVALWLARQGGRRGLAEQDIIPSSLPPIGKQDEDWLSLAFAGYQGPAFRLRIDKIRRRGSFAGHGAASSPAGRLDQAIFSAAEDFLTSAIGDTRLFDVVELEPRPDPGSAESAPATARADAVEPAAYVLLASIDTWARDVSGPRSGGAMRASERLESAVVMSFRILDALSHQVTFSAIEHAAITLPEGSDANAAIELAIRACINKGVWRVANWFKDRPWTGVISDIRGRQVDIGAGSRQGLAVGMTLAVLSGGRELFDDETGLGVGSVTDETGRLRITAVDDHSSIAVIVEGGDGIKPGDRVEIAIPRHRL